MEPTAPGWYMYNGTRNLMMFMLDRQGQWWVITDSGQHDRCSWDYIEQGTSVHRVRCVARFVP